MAQIPLKYVPAGQMKDKNLFIEEYFTAVDCDIYLNNKKCDYISSIRYTINEGVMPIYGYASYTYDDIAIGTRLVSGEIKIPVSNHETAIYDFTANGARTTNTTKQNTQTNTRPLWVTNKTTLSTSSYLDTVRNIYNNGYILNDNNITRMKTEFKQGEKIYRDVDLNDIVVVDKKPKYELSRETFFKSKYSENQFNEDIEKMTIRKNHKDLTIHIGNKIVKTIKDLVICSMSSAIDAEDGEIYEIFSFIARDLEESERNDAIV